MANPPIVLTDDQIQKLAEGLRGTCASFSEGLTYIDMDTSLDEMDFHENSLKGLSDLVFRCAECSWWHELSDMGQDFDDGETYCHDCKPEPDDDDDEDEELDEDDD